jgi:hypothetical protein
MQKLKCLFFIFIVLLSFMSAYSYPIYDSVEDLVKDMSNISINKASAKRVQSYLLEFDYGELSLDDGTYYTIQPFNGRVCAGLFVGSGYFDFNIPVNSEICSLMNKFKKNKISSEIEWAMIFSGDSLAENLGKPYQTDNNPNNPSNYTKYFRDYYTSYNRKIVFAKIGIDLLNGNFSNLKIIVVKTALEFDPLVYVYQPDSREEVALLRGRGDVRGDYLESLCSYTRKDYDSKSDTTLNNKDYVRTDKYNINIEFDKLYNMTFDINVDFTALRTTNKWLHCYLFEKCDIKEITLNNEKLKYFIDEKSSLLYIELSKSFNANEKFSLKFKYAGDLTNSYNGWTVLKDLNHWYPVFDLYVNAIFDIRAKYKEDKSKFLSVGDEIEHKIIDGVVNSRWLTPEPVNGAIYFIGPYDEIKDKAPTGEDLTILYKTASDIELFRETVNNSLMFYKNIFGEMPYKKLKFAESAGSNFALPGFAYLEQSSDLFRPILGTRIMHIPYIIFNQWFGCSSIQKSYRDDWITSGLGYYGSILYILSATKDVENMEKFLKALNELIINHQNLFDGKDATIVGNGYRSGDIAKKSAFIFHMLRELLLDNKTNDESLFIGILKDFYTNYKGKRFSTDDFRKIVEDKTGLDFSWFFEEWVNTNYIPRYRYAYKIATVNGKFVVKFKIKQENVPATFAMLVPVSLKKDNQQVCHYRTMVTGSNSVEFQLPPQDKEPDEIVFNPRYSVLCESDIVSWEDL